jgi:hypothetical protein
MALLPQQASWKQAFWNPEAGTICRHVSSICCRQVMDTTRLHLICQQRLHVFLNSFPCHHRISQVFSFSYSIMCMLSCVAAFLCLPVTIASHQARAILISDSKRPTQDLFELFITNFNMSCPHTYKHTYIYTYIHTCALSSKYVMTAYYHTFLSPYSYCSPRGLEFLHTYIHIYIYTYIHTCIHTYTHISIWQSLWFQSRLK